MLEMSFMAIMLLFIIIGAVEIISVFLHIFWRNGVKLTTFSVIPVKGSIENIEFLLRATKSELCWLKNGRGRLVILDFGLDDECKKAIKKMKGVELLEETELCPLLKSSIL